MQKLQRKAKVKSEMIWGNKCWAEPLRGGASRARFRKEQTAEDRISTPLRSRRFLGMLT